MIQPDELYVHILLLIGMIGWLNPFYNHNKFADTFFIFCILLALGYVTWLLIKFTGEKK